MAIIQLSLFPEKACPSCGQTKPFDQFAVEKRTPSGRSSYCRACLAERTRKWYAANREQLLIRVREDYYSNPDRYKERMRRWKESHPQTYSINTKRYQARKRDAPGRYTSEQWLLLCSQYDYRCAACGEEKPLQVDHVIPLSRGGSNDISNLQPLCKSCNAKKGAKHIDYRNK